MQKVLDALPESRDHTAEGQAEGKSPRTVSDNLSQEDEENKGEDVHWGDQEPTNTDDYSVITQKKLAEGSKAGAAQPLPESEP